MESRSIFFPVDDTPISVQVPDDASDQFCVTFGDPGSRVQIHADRAFLAELCRKVMGALHRTGYKPEVRG